MAREEHGLFSATARVLLVAVFIIANTVRSASITPELDEQRAYVQVQEEGVRERQQRFIAPPPATGERVSPQEQGAGKINFPGEQQINGFAAYVPPPSGLPPPVVPESTVPVRILPGASSQLFIQPGSRGTILLQVKNTGTVFSRFLFSAGDNLSGFGGLIVQPESADLGVGQEIEVRLTMSVPTTVYSGSVGTINFFARRQIDGAYAARQVLVQTRNEPYDTTIPYIRLITSTRCGDFLATNCAGRYWTTILEVGDSEAGLRTIETRPDTRFNGENFPIGTNVSVIMEYANTCCQSKVEILATDLRGNIRSFVVDQYTIDYVQLGSGDVAAITLGVFLVIILIIILVIWICRCRKRRSIKAVLKTSRTTDK